MSRWRTGRAELIAGFAVLTAAIGAAAGSGVSAGNGAGAVFGMGMGVGHGAGATTGTVTVTMVLVVVDLVANVGAGAPTTGKAFAGPDSWSSAARIVVSVARKNGFWPSSACSGDTTCTKARRPSMSRSR